jgi:hypothetical protein
MRRFMRVLCAMLLALSMVSYTNANGLWYTWVCVPAFGPNCSTALPCTSVGCFFPTGMCVATPLPLGICAPGVTLTGCSSTNWCSGSCTTNPRFSCQCTATGCG